ncbi:unnamed protein product [Tuwongella immobilis]|uniref:Uncharacterized protein n=1 Tax=Tuwongella immobilis TaxID=692036 RepID=A0A6C2YTA2_9BACT|nr:unnamed protein product [Tuwongella immobilis]VTS06751.1 unnamed protein product [Tuwongella immobilis]
MISTHFTAPPPVPHTPIFLKIASIQGSSLVEREDFTTDLTTRLRAL